MDGHIDQFPAAEHYETGNIWDSVLAEVRARLDDKNEVINDLKAQLAHKDQVFGQLIEKIPAPRVDHLAVRKQLAELKEKVASQQGMVRCAYDVLRGDLKSGLQ